MPCKAKVALDKCQSNPYAGVPRPGLIARWTCSWWYSWLTAELALLADAGLSCLCSALDCHATLHACTCGHPADKCTLVCAVLQKRSLPAHDHGRALFYAVCQTVVTVIAAVVLALVTEKTAVPDVFDWVAAFW